MAVEYTQIVESQVPADLTWDTPRRNQGQAVEVQYASPGARDGGAEGDLYKRVIDHTRNRKMTYYKRTGDSPWE